MEDALCVGKIRSVVSFWSTPARQRSFEGQYVIVHTCHTVELDCCVSGGSVELFFGRVDECLA